MRRTLVFSDELNYFPGVYLNLAGREPQGIVQAEARDAVILRARAALLGTLDPWSGRPVFRDVIPREELFDGPYIDRAPDLLLELDLDEGYSYNVMPSAAQSEPFRKLPKGEHLGKKGRSLPGSHRSHGFMTLTGPSIRSHGRIDAHIADLSATLLHRLDLAVPSAFQGRVLWEALEETGAGQATALPDVSQVRRRPRTNEGLVESRLRALGYIE
jgi:predicted AlkP superfamily phosphohydrolase/phosphomutase